MERFWKLHPRPLWSLPQSAPRQRSLSDLHCNQRYKGDSRYNQHDAGLEDSPDRFTSRCECTDDNSRENRQDAAR